MGMYTINNIYIKNTFLLSSFSHYTIHIFSAYNAT